MAQGPTSEHLLVRQLESIATLSEAAKKALSDLPMHLVDVETDQGIVREGDRPTRCCLVLEGFVISSSIPAMANVRYSAAICPAIFPTCRASTSPCWIAASRR